MQSAGIVQSVPNTRRPGVVRGFGEYALYEERNYTLTGVSRDSANAPLGGCTVTLFRVTNVGGVDVFTQEQVATSDASGNYSFVCDKTAAWSVRYDLPGSPVRAGVTLKTLAPA